MLPTLPILGLACAYVVGASRGFLGETDSGGLPGSNLHPTTSVINRARHTAASEHRPDWDLERERERDPVS